MAGLFFGLSFGLGGIGAALLGMLADQTSIDFVYQVCAFLPAVGLLGALLPHPRPTRRGLRRLHRSKQRRGRRRSAAAFASHCPQIQIVNGNVLSGHELGCAAGVTFSP